MALIAADYLWEYSKRTTSQLFGEIVNRVATSEKIIALTFDDGPARGYTQQILRILQDDKVRATFFLTGNAIDANPEEARLIVQSGHEVGNHSYNHLRMVFMSYSEISSELQRTDEAIRKVGHTGPIHFRPPYGRKLLILPLYLRNQGVKTITWDVAPESYGNGSNDSRDLTRQVLDEVQPGSIVLMHVMFQSRQSSMEAVPGIIHGLKDQGYRFVTVSELLRSSKG